MSKPQSRLLPVVYGLTPEHQRYGEDFARRVREFFAGHEGYRLECVLCGYQIWLDGYFEEPENMTLIYTDHHGLLRSWNWTIFAPFAQPIEDYDLNEVIR